MLINVGVFEPEPFDADPAVAEQVKAVIEQARAAVAADKRLHDVRAGTVPKLRAAVPPRYRDLHERNAQLTPTEDDEAKGELVRAVRALQADADAALDAALAEYRALSDDPPSRRPTSADLAWLNEHLRFLELAGWFGARDVLERHLVTLPTRDGKHGKAALAIPVLLGLRDRPGSGWDRHEVDAFLRRVEVVNRGADWYRGEYGQRAAHNARYKLGQLCQASIDHRGDLDRSIAARSGWFSDFGIEGAGAKLERERAEAVALDARLRVEALDALARGANPDVVMF